MADLFRSVGFWSLLADAPFAFQMNEGFGVYQLTAFIRVFLHMLCRTLMR